MIPNSNLLRAIAAISIPLATGSLHSAPEVAVPPSGTSPETTPNTGPKTTIIGGETGNGDFNSDSDPSDTRLFNATQHWFNLAGSEAGPNATKNTGSEIEGPMGDGTRHALLLKGPVFINNLGYKVRAAGEVFQIQLDFRDSIPKWADNSDAVEVFFFTTEGKVDGYTTESTISEVASISFSKITKDNQFETYLNRKAYITTADDVGKTIYVGFRADTTVGIGRVDNFIFDVFGKP